MKHKLQWGILSTGRIAGALARALAPSKTGELLAVGSRSQEAADKFGDEHKAPRRYGSYEALLADPDVEAVYIAPPHPMHVEWAIKAAEAGKHILCEKPIGINHAEAMAIIEAARRNDVFLLEAFMYRCHPQTAKLVELIREGAIGDVRVIQSSFSFNAGFNPKSRTYANELAGGGILDIGCYCTSMARLIVGAATGKQFAEPVDVKGHGHLGQTGIDEWAVGTLKFHGDIVAQVATGVAVGNENVVRVFGSEGWLVVPSPWFCKPPEGTPNITVHRNGDKKPREIFIKEKRGLYTVEADTVAAHIAKRQAPSPAMTWDDTLGNMKTLDQWRASMGFLYNSEKPTAHVPTVHRRPLRVQSGSVMKYGQIAGIDKPVSRLIIGCDNQLTLPHASVMFDDFFERGGNCFDTAHLYGGGLQERLLGQWVKNRGVRNQVAIILKGAHTPYCDPKNLTEQLLTSLDRIQTGHADLYVMHRDNPDVPIGEFIGVLNEHKRAGRIRAFGGSNWSLERVAAGNRYAKKHGLTGFSVVSNNFSLARMVDPVWPGCIRASDPQSRAWFKKTQTTLLAWSSQARGFFVHGSPKHRADGELVRCWYSEDNFSRLARVKELAKKKKVLPINIALAYVLNQPFPTYALIGPRTLEETRTSWPALEVELTPKELRWLNLEG
ncbi:MAG: oxidoreductase [Verrucomicrobiae bacterium]|nr:oxidoreductase [Verrucomicrobiae bacterium]